MIPLESIAVDALGYVAAFLVFLTFCMRTMLSLRLIAVASNAAFIVYGLAGGLTPILVLHGALLPVNLFQLAQMRRKVRIASEAARTAPGEESFEWLVPLGNPRALPAGASVFARGEPADSLFVIVTGEVRLPEVGVTLGPGALLGEIGLFSGQSRRTASAEAVGPVRLAELTERRVQELYFDNPDFAYRLIRLITRRLVEQLHQLEARAEGGTGGTAGAEDAPAVMLVPGGPSERAHVRAGSSP